MSSSSALAFTPTRFEASVSLVTLGAILWAIRHLGSYQRHLHQHRLRRVEMRTLHATAEISRLGVQARAAMALGKQVSLQAKKPPRRGYPDPLLVQKKLTRPLAQPYVLDQSGALHPFAIGDATMPPPANTTGYWKDADIARGAILLPTADGGYILDQSGALHPFAIGDATMPPPANTTGYWKDADIARGLVWAQ
jgi:hypothetical protein